MTLDDIIASETVVASSMHRGILVTKPNHVKGAPAGIFRRWEKVASGHWFVSGERRVADVTAFDFIGEALVKCLGVRNDA